MNLHRLFEWCFFFFNVLLKKLMTARPAATPQFTVMQTCRAARDLWGRPSTWRPTEASVDSGESECASDASVFHHLFDLLEKLTSLSVTPTIPDYAEPSLEDSRQQIQRLVHLKEGGYEQQQDPGWPGPPKLLHPHGTAEHTSALFFLMFLGPSL